ncbi:hypothetical protein [Actinoplanes sp. NPDC051851]|uniref:hypothetical protein n=1 Tax=Actinoplanes sp. NPDC051851 TaxID=3154753 RepID=UPI003434E95F
MLSVTVQPQPSAAGQPELRAPIIHSGVAPVRGLSAGLVRLAGGGHAAPHTHAHSETIIHIVAGFAATLAGDRLERVVLHAPGSVLYIAPGIPHLAVNLSGEERVLALETRTEPGFDDVVPLPELDAVAPSRIAEVRRSYAAGEFAGLLAGPTTATISIRTESLPGPEPVFL